MDTQRGKCHLVILYTLLENITKIFQFQNLYLNFLMGDDKSGMLTIEFNNDNYVHM